METKKPEPPTTVKLREEESTNFRLKDLFKIMVGTISLSLFCIFNAIGITIGINWLNENVIIGLLLTLSVAIIDIVGIFVMVRITESNFWNS